MPPADPFVHLPELDAARAVATPGARLDALRRAARILRARLAAAGPVLGVRSYPIARFPYPTRYALAGLPSSPAPFVMLENTMQIVQVAGAGGRRVTVLVNPTDPERARAAPFFARQIERYGERLTGRVLSRVVGGVAAALADAGLAPDDVDYVTFDHLHVQDLRGLLGTDAPEPGRASPTPALLPRARLLVQREELRPFAGLHPLQIPWYVADGMRDVPPDRVVALDRDVELGPGLALIRTPGHTEGNHTIVVGTARGLWTISENGVAVDAYAPDASAIRGLARAAREEDLEVVMNSNSRERSLDQYASMIVEKTLADPSRERPELPQHLASSQMIASWLAPGLAPTFRHGGGGIAHGELRPSAPAPR